MPSENQAQGRLGLRESRQHPVRSRSDASQVVSLRTQMRARPARSQCPLIGKRLAPTGGGMTQASDRLMGRGDASASMCGQALAAPEAPSRSFWISLHRWGCQAGAVVCPIALATLIMCSVKS